MLVEGTRQRLQGEEGEQMAEMGMAKMDKDRTALHHNIPPRVSILALIVVVVGNKKAGVILLEKNKKNKNKITTVMKYHPTNPQDTVIQVV